MPDLDPGTTVRGGDTPATVADTQIDLFTFNSTVFGEDVDSGTYVRCAVAFVAPTTGRTLLLYNAELDADGAAVSCNVAPIVRTGATIGSGTTIVAADLANAVRNVGTDARRYGASLLLTGLTGGASYNVVLVHRVSGGNGTIQYRNLIAMPTT